MNNRNFLAEMLTKNQVARTAPPVAPPTGIASQNMTLGTQQAFVPEAVLANQQALANSLLEQSRDRNVHPIARGLAAYFGTKQTQDVNQELQRTKAAEAEAAQKEAARKVALEERKFGLEERRTNAEIGKLTSEANKLKKEAEGGTTDPKELFDRADKLRDEFVKQSGAFVTQRDAYGRIVASAKDPSPAGDLALIFNYMKVLDPGSTVREGEFATAAAAGEFGDKIQNAVGKTLKGEKLTPDQRSDFVNRSNKLFTTSEKQQAKLADTYKGLSESFGVKPQNVVTEMGYAGEIPSAPTTVTPAPQQAATGGFKILGVK